MLGCILGMRPLLDLGRTQGQRAACVGHPVLNSHGGRGMARARHGTGPTWHWHGMARHGNGLEWHWHGTAWHWPVRHGTGMAWHGTGLEWHWHSMALAWNGTGPAWHWPGMACRVQRGLQCSLSSITAHRLNGSSHSSLRRSCGHTGTVPQSTRRVLTSSTQSTPCIDCAQRVGRSAASVPPRVRDKPAHRLRHRPDRPLRRRCMPGAVGKWHQLAFAHAAAFGMPRCWDAMPRWSALLWCDGRFVPVAGFVGHVGFCTA